MQESRRRFEKVLGFCQRSDLSCWRFEQCLVPLLARLGCLLLRLFFTARHQRLDVTPHLADGKYRRGAGYAQRTLQTAWGAVRGGRTQLIRLRGGAGFYPLDAVLGLTRDQLSPWMMQWVGRLATRLICKAALGWSPATETIEQGVLALGRQAAPFMQQLAAPPPEGEVLVIEVDGKCPPPATAEERAKRRGRRRPPGKVVRAVVSVIAARPND